MILDLYETKDFLKVEYDEEDSYILLLISVAEEYLKNSTGKQYDGSNSLARLFCLVIVSDLFQNRSFTIDKVSEKVRYTINSILIQLSYCYGSDSV